MSEEFSFNAPRYFLFASDNGTDEDDRERVETYFDVDHEKESHEEEEEENPKSPDSTACNEVSLKDDFYTPLKDDEVLDERRSTLRKSMSMSCLPTQRPIDEIDKISSAINNLKMTSSQTHTAKTNNSNSRRTINTITSSTSNLAKSKLRSASRDHLNKLAQPKRYASNENLKFKNNFVSMAEAINKFQNSTPVRFRSKPQNQAPVFPKAAYVQSTIPSSPKFATKDRKRPAHMLSAKEIEQKELEDMKKFKIKAKPVNKQMLQGPVCPKVPVEKKPLTVIKPFKITEMPMKKPPSPKPPKVEFHAKPVPKSVLEAPKPILKSMKHTEAHTPKFSKRLTLKERKPEPLKVVPPATKNAFKPTRTQPQPFSFEQRDKEIIKHREELLNKVLEEEKRAREFHARPPPKCIVKSSSSKNSSSGSVKSAQSEESVNSQAPLFKARTPTVLYKKPFEPKKPERPLLEITDFQLNTDKRAKEREEFDQKLKEIEEMKELIKRQKEEERLQREEEEIARLRKEIVHKAQPIRRYKEVTVQPSSKPLTDPCSPQFETDRLRNKENVNKSN